MVQGKSGNIDFNFDEQRNLVTIQLGDGQNVDKIYGRPQKVAGSLIAALRGERGEKVTLYGESNKTALQVTLYNGGTFVTIESLANKKLVTAFNDVEVQEIINAAEAVVPKK